MLTCNGTLVASGPDGSMTGTWGGFYDDAPVQELIRDRTDSIHADIVTILNTNVGISASLQSTYSLIDSVNINFGRWQGNGSYSEKTWAQISQQIDLINQQTSTLEVDVLRFHQETQHSIEDLNAKLDAMSVQINQKSQSIIGRITDVKSELQDIILSAVHSLRGFVVGVAQTALDPLYRLFKSGDSIVARVSDNVSGQPMVERSPYPDSSGPVLYSGFDPDGSAYLFAQSVEAYGLYHPWLGDGDFYYSDELAQVLSWPYRYSDEGDSDHG